MGRCTLRTGKRKGRGRWVVVGESFGGGVALWELGRKGGWRSCRARKKEWGEGGWGKSWKGWRREGFFEPFGSPETNRVSQFSGPTIGLMLVQRLFGSNSQPNRIGDQPVRSGPVFKSLYKVVSQENECNCFMSICRMGNLLSMNYDCFEATTWWWVRDDIDLPIAPPSWYTHVLKLVLIRLDLSWGRTGSHMIWLLE